MRPVHYLLIYIACMYFIAIVNISQVALWAFVPGFKPSTIVAICGMLMFMLNSYVEYKIDTNKIKLEDLL